MDLIIETDLWELQNTIMNEPTAGKVIAGTGGLRKLRFAPTGWKVGKRGALRVCYVYFPEHALVLLVVAYGKGEKDNLTDDEKKGIRNYIAQVEKWLDSLNE